MTWLCGPEVVLREEVVDHIRAELKPTDLDYVLMLAGSDKDRDIWAAANQYPMDPRANRLVVVRDAERIKNWKPLEQWFENTRTLPTVHLLFVSNESDLPYVFDQYRKKTSELKPYAALIRDKAGGALIRCTAPAAEVPRKDGKPTRPGPSDLVQWVQRQVNVRPEVAEYLLERTGVDLGLVKNVCSKAALFRGEMTEPVIDLLVSESPSSDYAACLVSLKKPKAFLALEALHPDEYLRTIGYLDYQLEVVSKLNVALRQKKTMREISQTPGLPVFAVRTLMPVAKHYDTARRNHCRQVLATADEALRAGVREGPMELLTALW